MLCGSPIHCSLLAFVIYSLVFQGHQGHSDPFQVTGPPDPITVAKGENVVLPCGFSPGQDAQDTEVIWFREQFSPFVHRYNEGQDQYEEQLLQYQGRTELLKDGLAKGSADLKIFHVQLSDTGSFTCFVRRGSDYDEAQVELKVTARGSSPLIALERYEHGGIRVACRSAGWYPRPQVLWHDPHGRHIPSLSEKTTQDKNGLFAAESSIILTKGVNQELSCSVQHIPHRPEQESTLYVSDPFFQDAHPWMIALGMVLVAVVALLIISIYLFRIKGKHQKEIEDRDAEIEEQAQELAWRRHAVPIEEGNVVLDPDTAHCALVVFDSGKSVKHGDTRQDVPDIPTRFNQQTCVLGRDGFSSGRHYWDIEVEQDGGRWGVGVSREDGKRKGYFRFKPEEAIWAVGKQGPYLIAFTFPAPTESPKIKAPRRIRVSLDYEGGRVSFFSVDDENPIFTFSQASFGGKKIYPWVWVDPGTCLKMCP